MANRGFGSTDEQTREEAGRKGGSQNTPDQQRARQENIQKAQEARSNS